MVLHTILHEWKNTVEMFLLWVTVQYCISEPSAWLLSQRVELCGGRLAGVYTVERDEQSQGLATQ